MLSSKVKACDIRFPLQEEVEDVNQKGGVIGAGLMGSGIAQVAAQSGLLFAPMPL